VPVAMNTESRRMQNETAKRSLKRNFRTFFKIAEIVRHESILHAIQAESEASIFRRGRRDRISARHLFPFGSVGLYRKPLSRNKADVVSAPHFEFEVFGKFGKGDRPRQLCVKSLKLCHHPFR
jgi:hypothetical protein